MFFVFKETFGRGGGTQGLLQLETCKALCNAYSLGEGIMLMSLTSKVHPQGK